MEIKEKGYDGHIIIDLGDDVLTHEDKDIHLCIGGAYSSVPLAEAAEIIENKSASLFVQPRDSENRPGSNYGKEDVEVLVDGKLKMSLLIDTNGGDALMVRNILRIINQVDKKRGRVDVYVPYRAKSAGAYIFSIASNRYVTTEAAFMWHPPYSFDDNVNPIYLNFATQAQWMRAIHSLFEKQSYPWVLPMMRDRIYTAFADPDNISNDVRFTAEELNEAGIITEIFPDVTGLQQKYFQGCSFLIEKILGSFFFNWARMNKWLIGKRRKDHVNF